MNPQISTSRSRLPQAFISTYGPRLRAYNNAILTPVVPQTQIQPLRTTKRGTTAINYAEDGYDDSDFDDPENSRRPTGLRSLRRLDDSSNTTQTLAKDGSGGSGKELLSPVELQGIWRDWMGKPRRIVSEKQAHVQASLPLTLIPIRIDVDIGSFRPEAPLPLPNNAREFGIDESSPAYRPQEPTPSYKLRDAFLWNLHEALLTPDQFAKQLVDELDFPNMIKHSIVVVVSKQIREQLEEYAGVALHPLFSPSNPANRPPTTTAAPSLIAASTNGTEARNTPAVGTPGPQTPAPFTAQPTPHPLSNSTPAPNDPPPVITATAELLPSSDAAAQPEQPTLADELNPPDTHRCVLNISFPLQNRLYTDRFEWSLLHPPGAAETFARTTCADLGLGGEWESLLTHAIYEAVLRLKKEACEKDGVLPGAADAALDNDAARPDPGAGWRFDAEGTLCARWQPSVERLSKEEIEKREGDRERQLRRVRRETARFTSTAAFSGGLDPGTPGPDDERMGRGERAKRKRRFRSLSPLGRNTPDSNAGAGAGGYGGGLGRLDDTARMSWRCRWCRVWGTAVWAVRDGPEGQQTLCHNCGYLYERDRELPRWSRNLFVHEINYAAPPRMR